MKLIEGILKKLEATDTMDTIDLATVVADMGLTECEVRRDEIAERIQRIQIIEPKKRPKVKGQPTNNGMPPIVSKTTDTHWDFMMKEMMWLATDFTSERKRQHTAGKKIANGIRMHHKTRETKRLRDFQEAETKRKRLAAKIGREVRGWWTKIERVIAYKQKIDAETSRNKAMNQQLVALVKQTERYGETLASKNDEDGADDTKITIEEALARANRRKNRQRDYSRLKVSDKDELYGESTSAESGSDGSFVVDSDSGDDETTMREAEVEETRERRRRRRSRLNGAVSNDDDDDDDDDNDEAFVADEDELAKLQEEADMNVNDIIERLRREGGAEGEAKIPEPEPEKPKKVKFDISSAKPATNEELNGFVQPESPTVAELDPGNEADDDLSNDDDEIMSDGSDEFQTDNNEVDDETTIEAEERLGREISVEKEIDLLQNEAEMPIEELRKMYAAMEHNQQPNEGDDDDQTPSATTSNQNEEPIGILSRTRRKRKPVGIAKSTVDEEPSNQNGSEDDKKPAAKPSGKIESNSQTSRTRRKRKPVGEANAPAAAASASAVGDMFNADDATEEDEFKPQHEVDDETTIEAEERLGQEIGPDQEISLLQKENEIPIEELRAMYAAMEEQQQQQQQESSDDELPRAVAPMPKSNLAELIDNAEHDEVDFEPDAMEVDDETTIAAEEKLGRDISYSDEIALLKQEGEMSVDELRAMYAGMAGDTNASDDENDTMVDSDSDDSDGEEEFEPIGEAVDDETTIADEERRGREMSYGEEIDLLKRESEMSVEELRAMYQGIDEADAKEPQDAPVQDNERQEEKAADTTVSRKRRKINGDNDDDALEAMKALKESEDKARSTSVSRPFLLATWVKLRAYQQVGLNWLVSTQTRRLNGILADEMGLGKTLQTISLLAYLASYKGIWGPHLIIVPTSCIVNWETEIKRFCPGMKVLCYYGSAKRRKELRTGWTKSNWYHIVITSYQLVVQDAFAFKRKKWYYMILDEAHSKFAHCVV